MRGANLDLLFLESGGVTEGMVKEPERDKRAEAIRKRKERKQRGKQIRDLIRSGDMLGAQKLAFTTIALAAPSEDCPDCLKLKRDAA